MFRTVLLETVLEQLGTTVLMNRMLFLSQLRKSVNLYNERCRNIRRKMQQQQQNVEMYSGIARCECSALTQLKLIEALT